MAGPILADPPPSEAANPTGEFDGLPIPPLDPTYFAQHITAADQGKIDGFPMELPEGDEFMLDDLDFDLSFDDIFLNNSDAVINPDFLADCLGSDPNRVDPSCYGLPGNQLMGNFDNSSGEEPPGAKFVPADLNCFGQPGSQLVRDFDDSSRYFKSTSAEFGNFSGNQAAGGVMVIDTSSPELRQSSSGSDVLNATSSTSSHQVSGDVAGYLNVPSPESNGSNHEGSRESANDNKGLGDARVLNCHSPESQDSGNFCSNVSEGLNYPSDSNKSVHSSPNFGNNSIKNGAVEEIIKLDGVNANTSNCSSLLKRKKSREDSNSISIHQKLTTVALSENLNNDEDEKKRARLIRNRESAQLSRQRKKHYVEELEDKVRIMHSTIQDLNAKISYIIVENATLKTQLGGAGIPSQVPPPPPGMYPHHPVMYPWMPYTPPYMVKPQGSQVPLVPIPKLKPQGAAPAPKSSKKVEKKRTEVKTKKVASVSFLGLLFFMLLFGWLVPLLNVRYGGMREPFMSGDSFGSGFYDKHHGRVLAVDGPVNGTGHSGKYSGKDYSSHCGRRGQEESAQPNVNGSDPLAASLYVPRNDKLVKIDGNLIIHSVLASEKAMASHGGADKNNTETGLAIPGDLAPAIAGSHPHLYRSPAVGQRALGTGEENGKSTVQQWFLEGVAGPLLSSGMCTEVFQFDVSSSAPGAVVPATNARNLSMEERQNVTHVHKVRNRRILNGPSVSLSRPSHNISEEQTGKQENFSGNKSLSSMVVSVLVDPREAGDGDVDGMMGPKSLSRIFVVVLIDSVKYVTYSCMLPFKGSVPLVTT
uniref:BZIP28 protein n=1 Tax=Nicotiana benthamiana TaxID=4100 RepID=A0A1B1FBS4_NICBE|nr:bZIP28 protein [Nicotiana benthamiana]UGZ04769.1 bZIP28B protein [Nicotiana benthamiana]